MNQITKCIQLIIALSVILFTFESNTAVAAPRGIYCLDSKIGIYRDSNIRSYPFVEGYAWRPLWSDMDTANGYDFAGVDHIISKLEPQGLKLNIAFLTPEPKYICEDPTILRWYDSSSLIGTTTAIGWRPVPWEPKVLSALEAFSEALSNHLVYSTTLAKSVPLRNHPVLTGVSFGLVGTKSAIRDPISDQCSCLINMPSYGRENIKNAVLRNIHAVTDNFPNNVGYMGFWKIKNDGAAPELWEYLRTTILSEFDGVKNPKMGFFQENLAASSPSAGGTVTGYPITSYAQPLYDSKNQTYTCFQALQGWQSPFSNPDKTANTLPSDAINFAFSNYNCHYVELYVNDLDYEYNNPQWDPSLPLWNDKLIGTSGYGDVNSDSVINISDVVMAAEIAVDSDSYSSDQMLRANVNDKTDMTVDISDVVLIAERAVGKTDPFPVEQ